MLWMGLALAMAPAEIEAALLVAQHDVAPRTGVELVRVPADLPSPALGVMLELTESEWRVDGVPVGRKGDELTQRLEAKAESAKALSRLVATDDFAFRGELLVMATPGVEASTLMWAFEQAHAASFPHIGLVVATGEAPSQALADPAYGAQLEERLAGLSDDARAEAVSSELEVLGTCAATRQVLASVTAASAERKQQVFREGLARALPSCEGIDAAQVVTVFQLMAPTAPAMGVLQVTLDPAGTQFAVDPTAPWRELAPWWARQPTGGAWWVPRSTP